VYHPAAILFTVLCRANGAMLRFCATPEVNETSDPTILCRDLTPNLVRAFLYWMCTQGTFKKLDSLLSHGRHWRMAVKYETQCSVPDPIAHDMSLVRYIGCHLRVVGPFGFGGGRGMGGSTETPYFLHSSPTHFH
jgi:hypothetical protein